MILADYETRTMIVDDENEVQEIMDKNCANGTVKSFKEKTVYEITIKYPKKRRAIYGR